MIIKRQSYWMKGWVGPLPGRDNKAAIPETQINLSNNDLRWYEVHRDDKRSVFAKILN